MKQMRAGCGRGGIIALFAGLLLPVSAFAQNDGPIEISGEASVVIGTADGVLASDADARVKLKSSTLLESGLEIGGVLEARVDGDTPEQASTQGRYSGFAAGGARGVGPMTGDAYLQGAYAYARGGFGLVSLGRDNGVASELAITSPTIFRAIGVNDWKTDLTGLNDVQTVNDFSGYSTKLTYMPPANFLGGILGGLQLGVSYAPELENCGDGLCEPLSPIESDALAAAVVPLTNATYEDVLETALYYEKAIGTGDRRMTFGLGASFLTAQGSDLNATITPSLTDDYEAYSVGVNVAYGGLTVGGSVKNSNAGLANDEDGYLAFDTGVTYETGKWGFMLGYGAADSDRLSGSNALLSDFYRETQSAQAGISYVFDHGVTLGAAAQFVDVTKSDVIGGDEESAAMMFESNFKF